MQGVVMLKRLMDRCGSYETALGRLRERLGTKETNVQKLLAWKNVQIGKLDLTKQLLKDSKEQVEALKKILKDKVAEILDAKSQLCQAKDVAIKEYRDSDDLLRELGSSFADDFDDCIRLVKASFLNLDLSHINIDAQPHTLAQLVSSVGTDNLFVGDTMTEPLSDGEIPVDQAKSVEDDVRALEGGRKDGEDSVP